MLIYSYILIVMTASGRDGNLYNKEIDINYNQDNSQTCI